MSELHNNPLTYEIYIVYYNSYIFSGATKNLKKFIFFNGKMNEHKKNNLVDFFNESRTCLDVPGEKSV